jgi:hypothetical protein
MHAIPETFTLDHLIGRTLTAVSFGAFDLHFLFAPKDDILCVGTVIVELGGQSTTVMDGSKLGNVDVLSKAPGRHVLHWRIEASHEFSITLTDGMKLRFISSDSPREDFVIFPGVQVV